MGMPTKMNSLWSSLPITLWVDILSLRYERDSQQKNSFEGGEWGKLGFPGGSDGEASAYNVGDPGSVSGLGGSPGEGNGNPLQYSCLENPMDQGAWWTTVHGMGL